MKNLKAKSVTTFMLLLAAIMLIVAPFVFQSKFQNVLAEAPYSFSASLEDSISEDTIKNLDDVKSFVGIGGTDGISSLINFGSTNYIDADKDLILFFNQLVDIEGLNSTAAGVVSIVKAQIVQNGQIKNITPSSGNNISYKFEELPYADIAVRIDFKIGSGVKQTMEYDFSYLRWDGLTLKEGITYKDGDNYFTSSADGKVLTHFAAVVDKKDAKIVSLIRKNSKVFLTNEQTIVFFYGDKSACLTGSPIETTATGFVVPDITCNTTGMTGTKFPFELSANSGEIEITSPAFSLSFSYQILELGQGVQPVLDENYYAKQHYSADVKMFLAITQNNQIVSLVGNGQTCMLTDEQELWLFFGDYNGGTFYKTELETKHLTSLSALSTSFSFAGKSQVLDTTGGYINKKITINAENEGRLDFSANFTMNYNGTTSGNRNISFYCYAFRLSTYQSLSSASGANVAFANYNEGSLLLNVDHDVARTIYSNYLNQKLTTLTYDPRKFDVSINYFYNNRNHIYNIISDGGDIVVDSSDDTTIACRLNGDGYIEVTFKDVGDYTISYSYKYFNGNEYVKLDNLNSELSNKKDIVHIFGFQMLYSSDKKELRAQDNSISADVTYKLNDFIDGDNVKAGVDKNSFIKTNIPPITFATGSGITKINSLLFKYENNGWVKQTTFNDVIQTQGYYIVLLKYKYGAYRTAAGEDPEHTHTQCFAFEISVANPEISVQSNSQDLYSGQYTNNDIIITAAKLSEFYDDVILSISFAEFTLNPNDMAYSELVNLSLKQHNADYLAQFTRNGKYKLKISFGLNASNSTTAYYFKDDIAISGITGIFTSTNATTGQTIIRDEDRFEAGRLFVDSPFTLVWDEKISGAKISAYYSFIQLKDVANLSSFNFKKNEKDFVANGFAIDTAQIASNIPFSNSLSGEIASKNVFSSAGLYIFNFRDAAGNVADYVVMYDDSKISVLQKECDAPETDYAEVNGANVIIKDTDILWGNGKAIKLILELDSDNKLTPESQEFINHLKGFGFKIVERDEDPVEYYLINDITKIIKQSTDAQAAEIYNKQDVINVVVNGEENLSQYSYFFYDLSSRNEAFRNEFTILSTTDQSKTNFNDGNETISPVGEKVDNENSKKTQYYKTIGYDSLLLSYENVSVEDIIASTQVEIKFYGQIYDMATKTLKYSATATDYTDILERTWVGNICTINLKFGDTLKNGKYVITRKYIPISESQSAKDALDAYAMSAIDYVSRELIIYVDFNDVLTYESKKYDDTNYAKEIGEYIYLSVKDSGENQLDLSNAKIFDEFYRQNQTSIELYSINGGENKTYQIPLFNKLTSIIQTNYMPNALYLPGYKYGSAIFDEDNENIITGFRPINERAFTKSGDLNADFKLQAEIYLYVNDTAILLENITNTQNGYLIYMLSKENIIANLHNAEAAGLIDLAEFKFDKLNFVIRIFDDVKGQKTDFGYATHNWWFGFTILTAGPQASIIAKNNNAQFSYERELVAGAETGEFYTNATEIDVTWDKSNSKYMAQIESVTINSQNITDDVSDGIVSCDISEIRDYKIQLKYAGAPTDYFEGGYLTEYTIHVNRTAPVGNIEQFADNIIGQNWHQTRMTGQCFNRTQTTGVFANYAYIVDADHNWSNNVQYFIKEFGSTTYKNSFIPATLPFETNAALSSPNLFIPEEYTAIEDITSKLTPGTNDKYIEVFEIDEFGNISYYILYIPSKITDAISVNNVVVNSSDYTNKAYGENLVVDCRTVGFVLNNISLAYDKWFKLSIGIDGDTNVSTKVFYGTLTTGLGLYDIDAEKEIKFSDLYNFQPGKVYNFTITDRINGEIFTLKLSLYNGLVINFSSIDDRNATFAIANNKAYMLSGFITAIKAFFLDNNTNIENQPNSEYSLVNNSLRVAYSNTLSQGYLGLVINAKMLSNGLPEEHIFTAPYLIGSTIHEVSFGSDEINDLNPLKEGDSDDNINYLSKRVEIVLPKAYLLFVNGVKINENEFEVDGDLRRYYLEASTDYTSSYDGGINRFDIEINFSFGALSILNDSRIYRFVIDNRLPKLKAMTNNGADKTPLFGSGLYTSEGMYIYYDLDELVKDDYIITAKKDGVSMDKFVSNIYLKDNGVYEFEVKFANPKYLHKKLYTIIIKKTNETAYSVIGRDDNDSGLGQVINQSSYYLYNDGEQLVQYPLYITNKSNITLSFDENLKLSIKDEVSLLSNDARYTLKKLTISNAGEEGVTRYINDEIIILKVEKTNDLLSEFYYIGKFNEKKALTNTSNKIHVSESEVLDQGRALRLYMSSHYASEYNKLKITIKFGEEYIYNNEVLDKSMTLRDLYQILLEESGMYEILVEDLAGNHHEFTYQKNKTLTYSLGYYNQIPIRVNGEMPIDYAVYNTSENDAVYVSLSNEISYNTGKNPKLSVLRNGEEYQPEFENNNWVFRNAGYYELKFYGAEKTISIDNTTETVKICPTTLCFSIIDSNDARLAYGWSEYKDYVVLSIKRDGKELQVKELGKSFSYSVLNGAQVGNYEVVIATKSKDVSSLDDISPDAEVYSFENGVKIQYLKGFKFRFSLRNSDVPIIISATQGTTTTDEILIKYNSNNVYSLLGNCNIVIDKDGKQTVYAINAENAANDVTELKITEAGSYYIKVYNNSGNLLYSYKVNKKDPLNTVAIIMIVGGAVVAVVLVILFIKLRKKVKIK